MGWIDIADKIRDKSWDPINNWCAPMTLWRIRRVFTNRIPGLNNHDVD